VSRLLLLPVNRPWLVLATLAALTLFFVTGIVDLGTGKVRLHIDPSFDAILSEHDPARIYYEGFKEEFGDDQSLIIAMVVDDIFTVENLAAVRRVSDELEKAEGVDHVVSLATANHVKSVGGGVEIQPFLEDLPQSVEEAEQLRREVLGNPVYGPNLVSADSTTTAFVVFTDETPEQEFTDRGLDRRMFEIATEQSGGAKILISGTASMRSEISRILRSDMTAMLPAVALIMAVIAFVTFRSARGVAVPLSVILVALVWTFGVIGWGEVPLNLVTTTLPVLLLTVGFAYSVHVVADYYEALSSDPVEVEAAGGPVAWAMGHVTTPVFLTVMTTIAGFLSLTMSDFPAVRQFGFIAVFGVLATAFVTVTLSPALLTLLGPPKKGESTEQAGRDGDENWFDRAIARLAEANVRHRKLIFVAAGGLALLSFWGLSQIIIDTHLVTNFDSDHPVRWNFEQINERLEGARPFSILLEADDSEAFLYSNNLEAVTELQEWLAEQPEIGGSTSFADYVRLLNRAFNDEDPTKLKIPNDSSLISQLMLVFGSNDDLPDYVNSDYSMAHIHVRSKCETTREINVLVERIEERLRRMPPGINAAATGSTVVLAHSIDAIAGGQIKSLSIAMGFIFLLLSVLFTSFRVGFMALLPNLLPVLAFFGVLGLTGTPLNATTGLIACVVLGIAVDDTIHFLTRFRAAARSLADEERGAVQALCEVARPVTTTSIALFLGFLVFTTGQLRNQTEFGALSAGILALAWLLDVTFTPALCSRLRIVTLFDALTFDLGDQPHKAIPVFDGLTQAQARIAALMTSVVEYEGGQRVMSRGETGRSLYVVIDGELMVSILDSNGNRMELATMKRGDVIGEVGLYHGQRTADVDTIGSARLLRLDHESLDRLHRRYPRIGRRLAWNVSAVMAERIARDSAQTANG
jgi:predicted RND superfamily exporter protein